MGLWDWSDIIARNTSQTYENLFKGSINVTIGTANAGFLGGRQTNVVGDDIRLVVDPEFLLFGDVSEALGNVLGPTIAGAGGNVTFTYGGNTGAIYGSNLVIRRGAETKVTCNSFLDPSADTTISASGGTPVQGPIDTVTAAAIGALSTLLIAAAVTQDVLVYMELQEPAPPPPPPPHWTGDGTPSAAPPSTAAPPSSADGKRSRLQPIPTPSNDQPKTISPPPPPPPSGPHKAAEWAKVIVPMLVPRLMGAIVAIETSGVGVRRFAAMAVAAEWKALNDDEAIETVEEDDSVIVDYEIRVPLNLELLFGDS